MRLGYRRPSSTRFGVRDFPEFVGPIRRSVRFAYREGRVVFIMKTAVSAFALKAAFAGGALLISGSVMAQAVQPSTDGTAQPSTGPAGDARPPSSNPWDSLPQMTAYRCLAEAVGTASDPKTGAPVRASINPETGKPLCPPAQPTTETTPPR
jgi:hypothetical protein